VCDEPVENAAEFFWLTRREENEMKERKCSRWKSRYRKEKNKKRGQQVTLPSSPFVLMCVIPSRPPPNATTPLFRKRNKQQNKTSEKKKNKKPQPPP